MSRIRRNWSDAEWDEVASRARVLAGTMVGGQEIFRQAQMVLPEARRYTVRDKVPVNGTLVKRFVAEMAKRGVLVPHRRRRAGARVGRPRKAAPQPEPAKPLPAAPEAELPLTAATMADLIVAFVRKGVAAAEALQETVAALARQGRFVADQLAAPPRQPLAVEPEAPPGAGPRRVRVFVVGMLPDQQRHLKQRTAALAVDFSFADSKQNPWFPQSAEYAVVMTKFVGHHWTDAAYAHMGTPRVRLVAGGLSECLRVVHRLVQGQP